MEFPTEYLNEDMSLAVYIYNITLNIYNQDIKQMEAAVIF